MFINYICLSMMLNVDDIIAHHFLAHVNVLMIDIQ